MTTHPRVNPVVLLSPVEDGYVAYDPVRDDLHHLNPVAALLTELSDGSRSVEDIRQLAGPLMPDGKVEEIDRWIDDSIKAGFLVWEGSASAAAREMTSQELAGLITRLKGNGNTQSAYLCAKRMVELKGGDASAWYDVGEIAHCLGKREEARDAYKKYLASNPDDGEIEHLLIALEDGAPPPRASDRAIQHIYKTFAATYETRMLDDLRYTGPERMKDALAATMGERMGLAVLDLGCGSGLAGVMIRPRAAELIGVDLSPEMIALAEARKIYDRLELAEITEWLGRDDRPFDLVMSCDCLIYFGDLGVITIAVARRLKPGGFFAMSMERGDKAPYHLTDTGRYIHHPDHVREAAAKAGFDVAHISDSFLRYEYGEEVIGLFAVLQKPGA